MPTVGSIPERYQLGLTKLISIDDETFQSLLVSLEQSTLVFSPKNLAKKVSAFIEKLSLSEIQSILSSVGSLIPIRESHEASSAVIAQDVSKAIIDSKTKFATLDDISEKKFQERLSKLLDNKQLYFAAKSVDLQTEYENVFISARIVTDFRPIFDIQPEPAPKAGMIVHSLHLHYHHGEEIDHRDVYIALDANDIKSMKQMLEQAEKRAKSLVSVFKESKMTVLNLEE